MKMIKLFYTNFDQLFDHLRVLCSNNNENVCSSSSISELMPLIEGNSYFAALRSVMEEEKQKMKPMTAEISCSSMALALSWNLSTAENDEKGKMCAVDQTLKECKKYCLDKSEFEGEIKEKMRQTLEEFEQFGQLMDQAFYNYLFKICNPILMMHFQNANFCLQYSSRRLFAVHAKLRPVTPGDVQQFNTVLKLKAKIWQNELKDAVCSQLLLIKARGGQKKKRQNFSRETIRILNDYFLGHIDSPYPDDSVKMALAEKCDITLAQVSNWFGNKRIRFRKSQLKAIGKEAAKCVPKREIIE